jgi:hypothetical protein
MMSWIEALRELAREKGHFRIPPKGSAEYDRAKAIQESGRGSVAGGGGRKKSAPKAKSAPKKRSVKADSIMGGDTQRELMEMERSMPKMKKARKAKKAPAKPKRVCKVKKVCKVRKVRSDKGKKRSGLPGDFSSETKASARALKFDEEGNIM